MCCISRPIVIVPRFVGTRQISLRSTEYTEYTSLRSTSKLMDKNKYTLYNYV